MVATLDTSFFMNFELLPILTNYEIKKRGDEIKKSPSPLKLLSQSQPNFAEMILRWANGHNFERGPPKDHFSKVWLRLVQ
jgi:hypothetical protein